MSDQPTTVFTIGHSTHTIEAFVGLLHQHGITAIADVRSSPFSSFNPQFNKDILERILRLQDIQYVFLGRELGARPVDTSCYENGQVSFVRLAKTELFQSGLDRVSQGSQNYRIALMCAEKEPLECHRTILVARALAERGIPILHILADGQLETYDSSLRRLLALVGLPNEDLFSTWDQLAAEALSRQASRIAYANNADKTDIEGNLI
jgi:uncharacterized protein (DUF488 family)